MALDIASLQKVLALEREKGYNDRAVIGGLDRYLRRWAKKAQESLHHPQLWQRFQELRLMEPSYALWDAPQRQEWIEAVLSFLQGVPQTQALPLSPLPVTRSPRTRPSPPTLSLDSLLSQLKGLGASTASRLGKLGVTTIRQLLYFFPRRYLDYSQRETISQLQVGEEATIMALVWEARGVVLGGRLGTEAIVGDETGNIRTVWFNNPYLAKKLVTNSRVVLSGRVGLFKGRKVLESPEWELAEGGELVHTGRLVPVYPLTEGLRPRWLRQRMKGIVEQWAPLVPDFLPPEIKEGQHLAPLPQAIAQAHFPDSQEALEAATKRLAFDELFLFQLGVLSRKRAWQGALGHPLAPHPEVVDRFLASLPFLLTPAQSRALGEILADLGKPLPMSRMLQGEVGSGKTVVAACALLVAAANDRQGAFMAPTEVLAEQHFHTLGQLLGDGEEGGDGCLRSYSRILPRPLTLALLLGSLRPSEKERLHSLLAQGQIDIVVGTHALIQKGVELPSLGLAVIDEQHRFGVLQRSALRQKGFNPHVLAMTATPIPRTLALTLYGDLDISVIDQLPPGRQEVKTRWLEPWDREWAYGFIREQIAQGNQAFIICPIIEESEVLEVKAAVEEYSRLSQSVFPDLRLGLLHGKMSLAEKEEVMRRFRAGELHILISTPVVEVGIDVPAATVMLIEGAERFGLAQLHQFRGRVGRGDRPSHCFLVTGNPTPEARERLAILERVRDGFVLAEEDLRLRGPGEFFGTRQSGLPELRMARLSDLPLLETAREEATKLFARDPELRAQEALAREVRKLFQDRGDWS